MAGPRAPLLRLLDAMSRHRGRVWLATSCSILNKLFDLAPPLLARKGADGRPRKIEFGPWIVPLFRVLAGLKRLRGTPFDPFGRTAERRMERALIDQYEADMRMVFADLTPDRMDPALALARLPTEIRGFGPVKEAAAQAAARRREELLAAFRAGGAPLARAAE